MWHRNPQSKCTICLKNIVALNFFTNEINTSQKKKIFLNSTFLILHPCSEEVLSKSVNRKTERPAILSMLGIVPGT